MTALESSKGGASPGGAAMGVAASAGAGVDRYISLRQPWASLLVAGVKRIETRGWATSFRGRIAIHAGKALGQDEVNACYRQPFAASLAKLGFNQPADLPRGAVIGWVTITDCLKMTRSLVEDRSAEGQDVRRFFALDRDPRLTVVEREFGAYEPGRYAWITGEERLVLAQPIPMRGLQRIQRLPEDVAARLAR